MALLTVEVIILLVLCATAYGIFKLDKLDINILDKDKLEAYRDTGPDEYCALWIGFQRG